MVVFQALTWEARDTEECDEHLISIFGKTEDGKSVCLTTSFAPYFLLNFPRIHRSKMFSGYIIISTHRDPAAW